MSAETSEPRKGVVLVVDDERLTRVTLEVLLRDEGFEVLATSNGFEAIALLEQHDVDVCLADLRMPSMDGLELQGIMRQRWPETAVIFMTAYGTVATAVEAMQKGAADYLTKPLHQEELLIRLRRLLQRRRERQEIGRLRLGAGLGRAREDVVYRSPAMVKAVERALSVADADVTVLLEGETGTGKLVFARMIHEASPRSGGPFLAVNCAELNQNLVESELFGHEAGAFTGAIRQRRGRFEAAAGGTILIDEADDLPREIQVRLLRFLQDHTFERVGSSRTLKGDVRVLCATKHDLAERVRAGAFREDLYYRINTIAIRIPPLRERPEDIVPLAEHFASKSARARGVAGPVGIDDEALRALLAHAWPGNVRELEHAIEHAVTFARGGPIGIAHLPEHISGRPEERIVRLHLQGRQSASHAAIMASCEDALFTWALSQTGGNQVRAAKLLGMSRTTFRGRLMSLRGGSMPAEDESEPMTDDRHLRDGD